MGKLGLKFPLSLFALQSFRSVHSSILVSINFFPIIVIRIFPRRQKRQLFVNRVSKPLRLLSICWIEIIENVLFCKFALRISHNYADRKQFISLFNSFMFWLSHTISILFLWLEFSSLWIQLKLASWLRGFVTHIRIIEIFKMRIIKYVS